VKYNLAAMTRRTRNPRRSNIIIRDIVPPATLATNLYLAAYKPVVQVWERATQGIVDEYARTLSQMTTDSPADLQARLDAATTELERLYIILDAALRDWAVHTELWYRGKWRGAILSATGVDLQTLLGPEDVRQTLDSIIAWNISLVRDVGEQARQRIGNAVFSGLNQRKPAREVAKEIREATGMARDRSQRIASDQLTKLTSALADERRREAGISLWKWRWSHKLHGRKEHIARDGNIYADDAAGAGVTVNGDEVLEPPEDRPGQLPFCGCRGQSVLVLD
jgi:uncharacterized protein with gpF-like domain